MSVFVDTSALIALLDGDQPAHAAVAAAWDEALAADRPLVTSNYIVVETMAVTQRRMGMAAVRAVAGIFVPLMRVMFVTEETHAAAAAAFLTAHRRRLSFVDCTSFELMRRHGIPEALACDADFARQGFRLLPRS